MAVEPDGKLKIVDLSNTDSRKKSRSSATDVDLLTYLNQTTSGGYYYQYLRNYSDYIATGVPFGVADILNFSSIQALYNEEMSTTNTSTVSIMTISDFLKASSGLKTNTSCTYTYNSTQPEACFKTGASVNNWIISSAGGDRNSFYLMNNEKNVTGYSATYQRKYANGSVRYYLAFEPVSTVFNYYPEEKL